PTTTHPSRHLDAAWDAVQVARHVDRPTTLDYIHRISPQFIELHGDRTFGDDPAVVAGLGEVGGRGVVFVGLERGHGDPARRGGAALPEGYRKALRMMRLAERIGCPLVTFIDTPGAYLGVEAEERGLAASLSECLATMSALPVPIVAAIVGEGGSGGALALGVADRVLMQEHAIYSVIAPEGAAAILYRDVARAPEVAEALKIMAADCIKLGVADTLVPEPSGAAHSDPDLAAALLRDALVNALAEIQGASGRRLAAHRYRKFRQMGQVNTYWREFVSREASDFGTRFARTVGSLRGRISGQDNHDAAESDGDEMSKP
ncbi:MAG: carboxyltransferase subunit alpha, partial [Thermomicrobiales bacterium]